MHAEPTLTRSCIQEKPLQISPGVALSAEEVSQGKSSVRIFENQRRKEVHGKHDWSHKHLKNSVSTITVHQHADKPCRIDLDSLRTMGIALR